MKYLHYTLALLLMSASTCLCRPQTTIDSQDVPISPELDPESSGAVGASAAWRKLYSGYDPSNASQRYQSLIEEVRQQQQQQTVSPLERLQIEIMTRLAQQPNSINGGGPDGLPWENLNMYRMPKRQVRFRQCYFNPISCFRK